MEYLHGIRGLKMAPWVVSASWPCGKRDHLVMCSLVQWSAGSRGIWCSRDGRENPSNRLGSETEEAFFG